MSARHLWEISCSEQYRQYIDKKLIVDTSGPIFKKRFQDFKTFFSVKKKKQAHINKNTLIMDF